MEGKFLLYFFKIIDFDFEFVMKTYPTQTGMEFFFHRYLIDSKKFNSDKKSLFQNEEQINFTSSDFGYSKTSLHKCRMVQIGEENLQEWPMYLLKRISYINQKKQKKGKAYQVFDQNIKKISQIRTEYLCYQIMKKSHRVVRMIELINENPNKQEDQKFFYKFMGRKKQHGVRNACFILELCNDGTLEDKISSNRNLLTEDQIIMYCCQVLEGLIQLKKKGILHRDLRPCNIFMHNNEIKFGDFDSAFIYKQSQCTDIKSGIDINTTPQQIVELASLSDEELQSIGNLKLFELQSKCDIYFFGMIVFKMIFKRDYQKKFQGTDIEYLIREKIKEGFSCSKLLDVMKKCLYTNVEKRIDLSTLIQKMRIIEKQHYFSSQFKQRTYLSDDPLNLFRFNSLQSVETDIMSQIQNSISNTFTLSFVSVQYDFESDFQKAAFTRSTRLYADEVLRVHSKYYKSKDKQQLWNQKLEKRKQLDKFMQLMEDFVIQMSIRAYYYDYLYKVILKINTISITKKEQKQIITENKKNLQRQLIFVLKFLFEILHRTPFKIDKYYDDKNLPYETRKLFKNKVKINDKYNFFQGRARIFNQDESSTNQMINKFFLIEYEDIDSDNFQVVYENIIYMIQNVDLKLKSLLRQSIVDLFRPYDSSRKAKSSQLKEILFILITLENQDLKKMKKSNTVLMKNLLEPLFNGSVTLEAQQAQIFFDNYKVIHQKQVEQSKRKEGVKISMNLFAVSKKHLNCLAAFMAPFANLRSPQGNEVQAFEEKKHEQNNQAEQGKSSKKRVKSVKFNSKYQDQTSYKESINNRSEKQNIEVEMFQESHLGEFSEYNNSNNPIRI